MKLDQEKIEKQAKDIMDSFLQELAQSTSDAHFGVEREREVRAPVHEPCDETFRRAFLANAPKTKDDLLIMERKHW